MSSQQTQQAIRSDDQFRKAISKLVRGLEKRDQELRERRQYHRFKFGMKVNLCTNPRGDEYKTICEAWAVDLSIGGMCFMTERALREDAVIYINFECIVGKPCYIPIKICHSRQLIGSVYEVHSKFACAEENPQ